jgi:hypothetical protein
MTRRKGGRFGFEGEVKGEARASAVLPGNYIIERIFPTGFAVSQNIISPSLLLFPVTQSQSESDHRSQSQNDAFESQPLAFPPSPSNSTSCEGYGGRTPTRARSALVLSPPSSSPITQSRQQPGGRVTLSSRLKDILSRPLLFTLTATTTLSSSFPPLFLASPSLSLPSSLSTM